MPTMTTEALIERMKGIPEFILSKIAEILDCYDKESTVAEGFLFERCPKCGEIHPRIIKGGKTSTGKQMFRCMDCQRRFTADYGTYSFYSHQSPEAWNELIKMTITGETLETISLALDVNIATAFRMRHKLLCSLEDEEASARISDQAELDEKYVVKSHKGEKMEHVAGKKRGTPSVKRGISNDQVCLLAGVQRGGGSYLRSFNMARPTSGEVMNLYPHIEEKTYIWTDDCPSNYRYQVRIPHFPQKPASEAFRLRFRDFGYRVKLPRNPRPANQASIWLLLWLRFSLHFPKRQRSF